MGTAYNRSWSYSRQATYNRCPRSFFYTYFPWGEPNQNQIVDCKQVTTLAEVIGQVAHRTVANALRKYAKRKGKFFPKDLTIPAVIDFDSRLMESEFLYPFLRKGTRPPSKYGVLQHHIESGPSEYLESAARKALCDSLSAFEQSEAWEILRNSETDKWLHINSDIDPKRTVSASRGLGFQRAYGLKLYTEFDLALRHRGDFIIVDWKTGKKSPQAIETAKKQTCGYALWALNYGIDLLVIRTQPFWLRPGEKWDPQPVQRESVDSLCREIEEQDALERNLLKVVKNEKGRNVFQANIQDFPANVSPVCKFCKFLKVCQEGQKAVQGLKE